MKTYLSVFALVAVLSGCGGGGGSAVLPPEKTASELAQICSVDNILSGDAATATQQGVLARALFLVQGYPGGECR